MKTIPLSQGQVALVDDADFEVVNQFKWYATKRKHTFYAVRHIKKPDGSDTIQYLHRFLLPGIDRVDHEDGDGLNNRREKNLRPATAQQNSQGVCRKRPGATSRFRGVSWDKKLGKWKAEISIEGEYRYLGLLESEEDAAHAFDASARKYRGESAHQNFRIT